MFVTLSLPQPNPTQPNSLRRARLTLNAPPPMVPLPHPRRHRRRRSREGLHSPQAPRQGRRDRDIPTPIGEARVLDDPDLRGHPHRHARSVSPVCCTLRGWSFGVVRIRAGGGMRVRGEGARGFALVLDRKEKPRLLLLLLVTLSSLHVCTGNVVSNHKYIAFVWGFETWLVFTSSKSSKEWAQGNKYFHVLSKGVKHDGWKFVLLARFSPIPSYVINYALAATEVSYFVDFLLPTVIGCLPMILQNTSLGSLANAAVTSASGSKKSLVRSYVLPLLGVTSSILISLKIRKYSKNIVVDDENIYNPRNDSDSSAVLEGKLTEIPKKRQ
ncbi:hypothetical protein AKJ16_DCAP10191 [Drosera capensis]